MLVFAERPAAPASPGGAECARYAGPMGLGATELLTCSPPVTGRYVMLARPLEHDPINFCEVEVYAQGESMSRQFIQDFTCHVDCITLRMQKTFLRHQDIYLSFV